MDYSVGSVAALISGNVTPNRPRLIKKPLTPTKHQPSPNVTPKSELIDDRSIFLSPSVQKKKDIVKKSPKRIFENPDLDATANSDGNSAALSPKADKVKKHLKNDLEAESSVNFSPKSPKSPKKAKGRLSKSVYEDTSNTTVENTGDWFTENGDADFQSKNESTPKKKKKQRNSNVQPVEEEKENKVEDMEVDAVQKSPESSKKKRKLGKLLIDYKSKTNDSPIKASDESPSKKRKQIKSEVEEKASGEKIVNEGPPKKKKNKNKKPKQNLTTPPESTEMETSKQQKLSQIAKKLRKKKNKQKSVLNLMKTTNNDAEHESDSNIAPGATETANTNLEKSLIKVKKSKKKKNKQKVNVNPDKIINKVEEIETVNINQEESPKKSKKSVKKKNKQSPAVNPNAITNKDTDSEHESDNEIESENEQINNKVLDTGPNDSDSSDEEAEQETKSKKKPEKGQVLKERDIEEEIKRTLFVGNVPFSKKCKKEVRHIFVKHGPIETIRVRTIPVKDARYTPKLAVIKNELHPERTTVNVYVKYKHTDSVEKALSENNTALNGYHLRVSRSEVTGTEHDPRMAVFVGNLPFNIEDDVLRAKFEKCGEIESVRVIRDRKTSAGKGFGYVNFASRDGVELALAMSEEDLTIKNRILRVKRCTMTMGRRDQAHSERPGRNQGFQGRSERQGPYGRFQGQRNGPPAGGPGRFQGQQGNQDRFQGPRDRQGPPGKFQGPPGKFQGPSGKFQSPPGKFQGPPGKFQGSQGRFNEQQGPKYQDGAFRRIMKKRGIEDPPDGPPNKQPRPDRSREKKTRKEFVGVTAEKKNNKKRKFNKGEKKKKALSEILTK